MTQLIEILGSGFGDNRAQYKESVYPMLIQAYPKLRLTPRIIDVHVKKYAEYGFIRAIPDMKNKGFKMWQITNKGIAALDYYRNAARYKRLEDDVLAKKYA
jgi:hypothetical protein